MVRNWLHPASCCAYDMTLCFCLLRCRWIKLIEVLVCWAGTKAAARPPVAVHV